MKILRDKAYEEATTNAYDNGYRAGMADQYPTVWFQTHGEVQIHPLRTTVTHEWAEIPEGPYDE